MLKAWITFLGERFPIPVFVVMCGGISLSTALLTESLHNYFGIIFSMMSTILFFLTLRIMDEYKDYQKDLIAHPDRPLPRGLISISSAKNAIRLLLLVMLATALAATLYFSSAAGLLYFVVIGWLYLMFREFFAHERLSRSPLLYAFTHQIILFPLILFSCALFEPLEISFARKLFYVLSIFFTFFTYEISRKLDPSAPLILGTYWRVSGKSRTSIFLLTLIICGMISAYCLLQSVIVAIVSITTLLAFLVFMRIPQHFKLVEVASSVSLLVHIWSVGLWRLFV